MWDAETRESLWCCCDVLFDHMAACFSDRPSLCMILQVKGESESDVTAFVLAGGKSSRMGSDKAFLRLGEETLLSQALKIAGAVTRQVRIVGNASKFAAFGQVVEDLYRDRGPLGGIHAALSSSVTELNLMLAVDLPFVGLKFLKYLLMRARESGAIVTVPRAGSGLQPLCAIYRRGFLEAAEESLREGKNRIDSLFTKDVAFVIEESELARAGFSVEMFRNLNTPEEFEMARAVRSPMRN
jgi:molybdopterin-guanine dinucleotide biosynthesis protein A